MATIGPKSDAMKGLARGLIEASQQPTLLFDADLRVVGASRSFCATFSLSPNADAGPGARIALTHLATVAA